MLVVQAADKPTRPAPREAPRKTAPTPTKQPGVPTPDAAKPLAELTPKTSTPKSPQPPKNDKKNEKKPVCSFEFILPSLCHSLSPLVYPCCCSRATRAETRSRELAPCEIANTTEPSSFNTRSPATKTVPACLWVSDEGSSVQLR